MIKVEAYSLKLNWPLKVSSLIVSAATLEASPYKKLQSASYSSASKTSGSFIITRDQKVRMLGNYLEEGTFLANILQKGKEGMKSSSHLQRSGVVYIIFKTWQKSHEDANIFWSHVRDGENLKYDMPEMQLREFLKGSSSLIGRRAFVSHAVSVHEYAYRCAIAWNAYRAKRPTRLTYYPEKVVPKII